MYYWIVTFTVIVFAAAGFIADERGHPEVGFGFLIAAVLSFAIGILAAPV